MTRPTVHDIAKEAGVSLATVDRVLNARPGVRPATVERVQHAIERLGYVRDMHAANLARQKRYKFLFLLPDGPSQFLEGLRTAIDEASRAAFADRADLRVFSVPYDDPVAVQRVQRNVLAAGADGVAIMANETPLVRDMIVHFKEAGMSVVSLVTDQPQASRDHFVGIDNRAAGRTAGVLMGRFVGAGPGRIAVVVNSMQARDMVERRLGFDEVMQRDCPHLDVLPSVEGRDSHDLTAEVLSRCLDNADGVRGIYCVGAGTRGVTQVVRERGLQDDVVVVAHELTNHTRSALTEGLVDVVITQNVGHLARSALRVLRAGCDGAPIIASQETIRIEIVLKENLT